MTLLNFRRVTLRAFNIHAERNRRDRFGHGLIIVFALVKKPFSFQGRFCAKEVWSKRIHFSSGLRWLRCALLTSLLRPSARRRKLPTCASRIRRSQGDARRVQRGEFSSAMPRTA